MEVTKENFSAVLPQILEDIDRCDFIAFDTEFTGLYVLDRDLRSSWADLPEERYHKQRQCSGQFSLIQVGLCMFFKSEDGNLRRFSAKPYNFYVFPASQLKRLDRRFMCQPSSLSMLAAHGIDFNKWIASGIPYMSEVDEQWWRGRVEGGEGRGEGKMDVNMELGFSLVVHAISKTGKAMVGHNIMLDVLHLYSHFIAPLPESLTQFKADLHRKFPRLYDTKVIVNQQELERLAFTDSLPDLYDRVQHPPFTKISVSLPTTCAPYASSRAPHEAAYDAYITGYALIAMLFYTAPVGDEADGATAHGDLLAPFAGQENRVHLSRCVGTTSLQLTGDEPPLSRDHVFLMTFPQDMEESDIKDLFSPFGGCRVCWINSTCAHVVMLNEDRAKEASDSLVALGAVSGMTFALSPYVPFQTRREAGKRRGLKRKLDQEGDDGGDDGRKVLPPANTLFDMDAEWPQ